MALKTSKKSNTNPPKREQIEKVESRSLKVMTKIQAGTTYNRGDKLK